VVGHPSNEPIDFRCRIMKFPYFLDMSSAECESITTQRHW